MRNACTLTLTSGLSLVDELLGGLGLEHADCVGVCIDLALQVVRLDDVGVDDADRADTGGREVQESGRAEPSGSDDENLRLEHLHLARLADLGKDQVPRSNGRACRMIEDARDRVVVAEVLPAGEPARHRETLL